MTTGRSCRGNSTASWLAKRDALINEIFGRGPGVLSNKSIPDEVLKYPGYPGLQGLVWNLSALFPINSTVFYSPVHPGRRSQSAFFFHHGHSNCVCPHARSDPVLVAFKCRPGCNSSMPTEAETEMPGYSWWDLYNVSEWVHGLGYDLFIFSMPLKGVNLGPGSTHTFLNSGHWCARAPHNNPVEPHPACRLPAVIVSSDAVLLHVWPS